jgi:SAM-dependent methyltransferase
MKMSARSAIHRLGLAYASWLSTHEYRHQVFSGLNERPIEYAFLLRQVARLGPRSVLDVGTGTTALPAVLRDCGCLVTAVDNVRDYWSSGMVNRHWHVVDDDIRRPSIAGPFDLVACISVLEHIPMHQAAVKAMLGLLSDDGHLVLTAPYNERSYCPNVYELPGSDALDKSVPFVAQSFSRHELDQWLAMGARVVEQEHWQFYDSDYWSVGMRLPMPKQVGASDCHQLSCILLQKGQPSP